MANNFSALRAKIKTILDALVTAGTLGSVMNGEVNPMDAELTATPCAEIVRTSTEPELFDNVSDLQNYIFTINLYYPLPDDAYQTAEIAMDNVVDAVLQAFLADVGLTGSLTGRMQPIVNGGSVIAWKGKMYRRDVVTLKCPKMVSMV